MFNLPQLQSGFNLLLLADGEAPPAEDLVQCNTCKRCFFPKVLVKKYFFFEDDAVDLVQLKFET